jgi:MoaA/NifB/PqqE/SkfB family radical SAM enzyme
MGWAQESDIGRIQIELTNYCNAACPQCERHHLKQISDIKPEDRWEENANFDLSLNDSYISLKEIQETFIKGRWKHLDDIHFCGNVDEPVINPEIIEIIKYMDTLAPNITMWIATNGGTRSTSFWKELGELSSSMDDRLVVIWGIDGLEDTNHLYRKNVDWNKLKENWRAYISAGGRAKWQFIVFNWNQHQLNEVKSYSESEKFNGFNIIRSVRSEDDVKPTIEIPTEYERNTT